MYSCTKSVLGALVGIARKDGYIDSLDHKVLDYFKDRTIQNVDERKQAITLKHLLSMTGGVKFNEWALPYTSPQNDYIKAVSSPDVVQYVLDLPMAADPGTVWNYCGGYTDLLGAIVANVTKATTLEYATTKMFTPLGITNISWSKNNSGLYNVAGGLSLTPRDQAKFGFLYLHNGNWDGKQIVPANFVAESVATQHSFNFGSGYGWESWWTYPMDEYYTAQGILGQRICVVPGKDLIVVFSANMTTTDPTPPENNIMSTYILPACK
jgi:CubicO group peptidase (beta-lactamase class C family)